MLLFVVLSVIFVFGDTAYVTKLPKCSMTNNKCQRDLFEAVLKDIAKTGLKELGIPPLDPLELRNVSVSMLDLIDTSLVEGVARGVKDCQIHSIDTNIPMGRASIDVTCDLTVKGKYKAFSSNPLVKSLLGGNVIKGDGFSKVKVEKLNIKFDFVIHIYKDEDEEVYLSPIYNQTMYDVKFLGNITFFATNIFVGDVDVSELISQILNQNGKTFAPFFGKPFIEKALEIVYKYASMWFEAVPAKFYIQEDLSPYIIKKLKLHQSKQNANLGVFGNGYL